MNIDLNDDQLNTLLTAAILQALGEKSKEQIISHVVKYLTTPVRNSYTRETSSPLLSAMNEAATNVARTIVSEKLKDDSEFKATIDSMIEDALRGLVADREKIVNKMSESFRQALYSRD